ncbi:MAG: hypothetical protein R3B54_11320 [Bdellovibrionota bacterium]
MYRYLLLASVLLLLNGCFFPQHIGVLDSPGQPPKRTTVGNGGGGDHRPMTALFLGEKEVTYCYGLHPDFGVDGDTVEALLPQIMRKVQDYLKDRRVNEQADVSDDEPKLIFNHRFAGECQGGEDLRVLLGDDDALEAKHFENHREEVGFFEGSYDPEARWGNADIYIARTTQFGIGSGWAPYNGLLEGIVKHEVLHALGFDHRANTIMAPDLGAQIIAEMKRGESSDKFQEIDKDWGSELVSCVACDLQIGGHLYFDGVVPGFPKDRDPSASLRIRGRKVYLSAIFSKFAAKGRILRTLYTQLSGQPPVFRKTYQRGDKLVARTIDPVMIDYSVEFNDGYETEIYNLRRNDGTYKISLRPWKSDNINAFNFSSRIDAPEGIDALPKD